MSAKTSYIQRICDTVAAQCHAAYPALTIEFLIHQPGGLQEVMERTADKVQRHRAGDSAMTILEKTPMTERSSLLGIAMNTRKAFFGLIPKDRFLALVNINTDDVDDTHQARHLAYHLAWHAIDLMQYRMTPQARERYQDGPMVPKRSALGIAAANMKADIFATAMNAAQGQKNAPELLAKNRAQESVTPFIRHRVEDYPYVIAAEATQYALADLEKRGMPAANILIKKINALALEIGQQFAEQQLKQWQSFASPAQNMAWAGHSSEEILGAAVNTSENPYIRTTGYLVAEFSGITPLSASTMMSRYNSFTSFERNERLHKERMQSIFDAALSRSLISEDAAAFSDAANTQNEQLAEGQALGWCAGALQAAGETFGSFIGDGKEQAATKARSRFNDEKEQTDWKAISEIGEKVIDQKREGYTMTIHHVSQMCEDNPQYASILSSLKHTMQDPGYIQKLAAANDLAHGVRAAGPRGPAPRGPAPKAAAPKGPAPAAALAPAAPMPAGPTLGGSSSQMVRAKMLMQQKRLAAAAQQQAQEKGE